ncbi:hypothetical protein TIROTHETA9_54 [Mycobacterium phage TiroTheta9]|uniref:Uncharacterized protein n=65 Tax=Backyardiganvirus TaxID=2946815 RepID=G1JZY9_9CAUD|nr:hypothetical protein TIROTHETA9_54 [Mycobacterium phage TiroTheta9]
MEALHARAVHRIPNRLRPRGRRRARSRVRQPCGTDPAEQQGDPDATWRGCQLASHQQRQIRSAGKDVMTQPNEYTETEFLGLDPDAPWWEGIHDYVHEGEDDE